MSREELLSLHGDRQLHFATPGNPKSPYLILFFSSIISLGTAIDASIPRSFSDLNPQYVAPSIPGNGESSSTPPNVLYKDNLCDNITALLKYLERDRDGNGIQHIFLGGASYGSVMAQMLFGAPFSRFPYGRKIRGLLLLSPFSPFREYTAYATGMKWSDWIAVGPLSHMILACVFAYSCKDVSGVAKLLDKALFSNMDEEEKMLLNSYAEEERRMSVADFKAEMAENIMRCSESWDGDIEVADVLHSDWGFSV